MFYHLHGNINTCLEKEKIASVPFFHHLLKWDTLGFLRGFRFLSSLYNDPPHARKPSGTQGTSGRKNRFKCREKIVTVYRIVVRKNAWESKFL